MGTASIAIFASGVKKAANKFDLAPNEYSVGIAASTAVEDGGYHFVTIYANFTYEIK